MAMNSTNERSYEDDVESMLCSSGWRAAPAQGWPRGAEVLGDEFLGFMRVTQDTEYARCIRSAGPQGVLRAMLAAIGSRGTLGVLKKGFDVGGVRVSAAYYRPTNDELSEGLARYKENRLTVTRQAPLTTGGSVDLLLAVNGIPVATCELKNQPTGSCVDDAVQQYKDRDPRDPLLSRALVHFAVDHDEVHMTTRLDGADTKFLPFNKGSRPGHKECTVGNPDRPGGRRTDYLWNEILSPDAFMNVVGSFMLTADGETVFPRYHQLSAVTELAREAAQRPSDCWLVQHSAGSGKTRTIAWLAAWLLRLVDDSRDQVFSSVIVVSDRRYLDDNLAAAMKALGHPSGVVAHVDSAAGLAAEVEKGTRAVVTTLQKFSFLPEDTTASGSSSRYAVIIDEAHNSQTGKSAREMRSWLEDANGRDNVAFFAFTATPKEETLQKFGKCQPDGTVGPHHLYGMRQAIDEGFIRDVTPSAVRYTRVEHRFRLDMDSEQDPLVLRHPTYHRLEKQARSDPLAIEKKANWVMDHFVENVVGLQGNRSRAMVVTESRKAAVRWALKLRGLGDRLGVGVLVAFSEDVELDERPGDSFTEKEMNGFGPAGLPGKFGSEGNEYRILVVADKYQTGFDQPLLQAMYVDKSLRGVSAVQTLSRLNRHAESKGELFVVDFANGCAALESAFEPYVGPASADSVDLKELRKRLADLCEEGILDMSEIDEFARAEDSPSRAASIEPARDRLSARTSDEQTRVRRDLRGIHDSCAAVLRLPQDLRDAQDFIDWLLLYESSSIPPGPELEGVTLEQYEILTEVPRPRLSPDEPPGPPSPTASPPGDASPQEAHLSEVVAELNKANCIDPADSEPSEDLVASRLRELVDRICLDERVRTVAGSSHNDFEKFRQSQTAPDLLVSAARGRTDLRKLGEAIAESDDASVSLLRAVYEQVRGSVQSSS